jgi:outer membrane immunogenic protein
MIAACAIVSSVHATEIAPAQEDAAPPPAAPKDFSWAGWHVGGRPAWISSSPATIPNDPVSQFGTGAPTETNGFVGGRQIGYNWQSGSIVYGVEADASFTSAEKEYLGYYANYNTKWNSMGSVRVRAGIADDRSLAYVTAGASWADVSTMYNPNTTTTGGLLSDTGRWGWIAGVGIEHAFSDAWSMKLEGLYLRPADEQRKGSQACDPAGGTSQGCLYGFDRDAWSLRLGGNYKW